MDKEAKTVVVTNQITVEVADYPTARIIKDLLEGSDGTALTDNISLYEYDPSEKILSVEIK